MICEAHYDCSDCNAAEEHEVSKWRRLLWWNHARYLPYEHTPYGDDGEMQCCGIDFKRATAEEIDIALVRRSLLIVQKADKP